MHTAWKAIMSVIFVEFITAVGSRRDLHNFLADDMGPTNQLTPSKLLTTKVYVAETIIKLDLNYPCQFHTIFSIGYLYCVKHKHRAPG